MICLIYFGMSSMKEGTSAQLSGRGELHGGARVTTLVTLRKCTLGNKREIKTLKFVLASTKGFKGGLAWIKPSKKDMAVTFSYSRSRRQWWSPTRLHKKTSDDERGKAAKRGQRDTSRKHKRGKVTRNTKGQPDICWFSLRGIVADGVDEDDLPRC